MLIKQRKQYGDNERKADRENLKKLLARAENIADGDGVKFSDVVGSGSFAGDNILEEI